MLHIEIHILFFIKICLNSLVFQVGISKFFSDLDLKMGHSKLFWSSLTGCVSNLLICGRAIYCKQSSKLTGIFFCSCPPPPGYINLCYAPDYDALQHFQIPGLDQGRRTWRGGGRGAQCPPPLFEALKKCPFLPKKNALLQMRSVPLSS